ncbi:hypothetical protein FS749_004101 [Ceratobasidium sp. UAMH 11750]|nr:hypothetical protein FS749_004101 [Ceratobasidium sp. UAMH 11750]
MEAPFGVFVPVTVIFGVLVPDILGVVPPLTLLVLPPVPVSVGALLVLRNPGVPGRSRTLLPPGVIVPSMGSSSRERSPSSEPPSASFESVSSSSSPSAESSP